MAENTALLSKQSFCQKLMSMLTFYFVGLPRALGANTQPYGITASETRSFICVEISDKSD